MKACIRIGLILILFIGILSCKSSNTTAITQDFLNDKGSFMYTAHPPFSDRPIRVWYYIPDNSQDAPVVMLMHGNSRNAPGYRDNMLEFAKKHQFILVVPEFSKDHFPKSRDYHQGGIFNADGEFVAQENNRSFSIIEPLFDEIKRRTGNNSEHYTLYGFSAGSQFVHRYMMFVPDNRADRVIAASAGYYTMPDYQIEYPYGLENTSLRKENLRKFLERDFTVMVGTADTVVSREDLVKSNAANLQGRDRVERAKHYYSTAKGMAKQEGIPFNWKFKLVPDVGHSNGQIAGPVANYLFDNSSLNGGLIVQGGGALDESLEDEILGKELRALASVSDPHVLIIPYAANPGRVDASARRYQDIFNRLGYQKISVLDLDDPEQALSKIQQSDIIWMPGGSQTLLKISLEQAALVDAIRQRNKEGIPIGGTSAGAAVMSEIMISSGKVMNNTDRMLPVMYQGLGLWPGAIVDQHFSERDRMERLEIALGNHPDLVGIGIDERTAVVVQGDSFRVVGANTVTVLQVVNPGSWDKKIKKTILRAPDRFELPRVNSGIRPTTVAFINKDSAKGVDTAELDLEQLQGSYRLTETTEIRIEDHAFSLDNEHFYSISQIEKERWQVQALDIEFSAQVKQGQLFLMIERFGEIAEIGKELPDAVLNPENSSRAQIADIMTPRLMIAHNVPGVSMALIMDGEVVSDMQYGLRNSDSGSRVDETSIFEACSMSKPVFAYFALRLVEQGLLDLDVPLVEYLGEDYTQDPRHREITARMVLTHTSGFPNWRPGGRSGGGPIPVLFEPGTGQQYSGEGIWFLQKATEKILGINNPAKDLDELLYESLLRPVGMQDSHYIWQEKYEHIYADGHNSKGAVKRENRRTYQEVNAAFSLYTRPVEYANFLIELMKTNRSAPHSLGQEQLTIMTTPQSDINSTQVLPRRDKTDTGTRHFGLGLRIDQLESGLRIGHTGSNSSGHKCVSDYNPQTGSGLVIMTNSDNGNKVYNALMSYLAD